MKNLLLIFHLIFALGYNLNAQLSNDLVTSPTLKTTLTDKGQQEATKLYFLAMESFPLQENGTLFLNEKFEKATIIDFEDEAIDVLFRYRFFDDEMQIMHLGKIKALYPQKVKQIIFEKNGDTSVFVPREYLSKKNENLGYFELLSSGKKSLLKKIQKDGKGNFKVVYYFQNGNNPAECFKVKKSAVLKILSNSKSVVSKFIVKNKLNVKKENDLKKVFDFYNSLH